MAAMYHASEIPLHQQRSLVDTSQKSLLDLAPKWEPMRDAAEIATATRSRHHSICRHAQPMYSRK
jgi:hypothetical protein